MAAQGKPKDNRTTQIMLGRRCVDCGSILRGLAMRISASTANAASDALGNTCRRPIPLDGLSESRKLIACEVSQTRFTDLTYGRVRKTSMISIDFNGFLWIWPDFRA